MNSSGPKVAFATAIGRTLASILLFAAAVGLLFEAWFWAKSPAVAAHLGRLPILSAIESWICRRGRWSALALFGAPVVVIDPFKAMALYAMAHGYVTGRGAASRASAATAIHGRGGGFPGRGTAPAALLPRRRRATKRRRSGTV